MAKVIRALDIKIRFLCDKDIPKIASIDESEYDLGAWSEQKFLEYIRNNPVIGWCVTIEDVIIGYLIYEVYKEYYEVQKLVIDRPHRKNGYGTKLLDKLKGKLFTQGDLAPIPKNPVDTIKIPVHDSKFESHKFLQKRRFKAEKVLPRYFKEDDYSDAYLMVYKKENTNDNTKTT